MAAVTSRAPEEIIKAQEATSKAAVATSSLLEAVEVDMVVVEASTVAGAQATAEVNVLPGGPRPNPEPSAVRTAWNQWGFSNRL